MQRCAAACCYPQWSPLPGSPWAERPPGAPTAIRRSFTTFPLPISGHGREREEKLNNTEDTRGTMVFRGHFNPLQTVSTSVRVGRIDRHSVGRRQKRPLSLWAVTLKRLQCCFVVYERDLVVVSFQLQLNYAAVPAKQFCLGQKMKRGLKSGAFLPMARSLGRVKKIIVVHIEIKKKEERITSKSAWSVAGIERAKGLMLWGGDGSVWHVSMCVRRPRTSLDAWEWIGFSWVVWERHCPLSFYHICSQTCGLLSCEHSASIKDLFISLFHIPMWKGFIHRARLSNPHPNFISYCQLGLTGSLWESRCLSLMLLHCGLLGWAGGIMRHVSACSNQGSPPNTHTHLPI